MSRFVYLSLTVQCHLKKTQLGSSEWYNESWHQIWQHIHNVVLEWITSKASSLRKAFLFVTYVTSLSIILAKQRSRGVSFRESSIDPVRKLEEPDPTYSSTVKLGNVTSSMAEHVHLHITKDLLLPGVCEWERGCGFAKVYRISHTLKPVQGWRIPHQV